ncbi:hypothetical protein AB0933_32315 [Streptomyces venezuelae]|uniref:hypothetical protein n=1 Tax=Streptomyces venezuelae TaxID=54571 RepID=UPI003451EA18
MTASRAKQADTALRRAQLVRLRLAGVPFGDQRILDLGYESRGHASKDFVRALQQHRDEEAAAVSVYRQQENERLDTLLEAAWPRATTPSPVFNKDGEHIADELDMRAVDTVLRLMDRRAKLNGLDMPVKAEVSGPGGGPLALSRVKMDELRTLINTAGDPDPDDEAPGEDRDVDDGDADDDSDD